MVLHHRESALCAWCSSLGSDCLLETVQPAADSGCLTIVGFVTHQQGLYACMHFMHCIYYYTQHMLIWNKLKKFSFKSKHPLVGHDVPNGVGVHPRTGTSQHATTTYYNTPFYRPVVQAQICVQFFWATEV